MTNVNGVIPLTKFSKIIEKNRSKLHSILPAHLQNARTYAMDLTDKSKDFDEIDLTDTQALIQRTNDLMKTNSAEIAIGRYAEKRKLYEQHEQYTDTDESRCIHLGLDITLKPGTPISAPFDAIVHSFADNNQSGDYGPTIILQHELDGFIFYTLYGHLSHESLNGLHSKKKINAGAVFAHVGHEDENGGWPPHLHLQIILDIGDHIGDYPGVASESEAAFYLNNCPDPGLIFPYLQRTQLT